MSLPRLQSPTDKTSSGSTKQLAEESVLVRRRTKDINQSLVKIAEPQSIMIVAKTMDDNILTFTLMLTKYFLGQRGTKPCSLNFDSIFSFSFSELAHTHTNLPSES